jgi:hypothetical protein
METIPSKNVRPGFLTIICILSFVGLGLQILKSLKLFIFGQLGPSYYNLMQDRLEESLNQVHSSNPFITSFIEKIFESILKLIDHAPLLATISIISSVIALAGVIMMWRLIKTGFYIYTVIKILDVFVPIIFIGFNFVSLFIALIGLFTSAIFITLYAFNLKAME